MRGRVVQLHLKPREAGAPGLPKRGPEFLRTMLGRRGWYARVLHGGTVRAGTPIEVTGH